MYKQIALIIILFLACEKKANVKPTSKYTLNNTQKWAMDEHTRSYANKMSAIFKTNSVPKDIEEFNRFGLVFETHLDSMIQGCTMQGKAHDQLHIFIGEIFQPLENLKTDSTLSHARQSFSFLKDELVEYNKFFK